jgi:hypothetical protein
MTSVIRAESPLASSQQRQGCRGRTFTNRWRAWRRSFPEIGGWSSGRQSAGQSYPSTFHDGLEHPPAGAPRGGEVFGGLRCEMDDDAGWLHTRSPRRVRQGGDKDRSLDVDGVVGSVLGRVLRTGPGVSLRKLVESPARSLSGGRLQVTRTIA